VLHEGDALPARNTLLRGQWVEPSESHVLVTEVLTVSDKLYVTGSLARASALGLDAFVDSGTLVRV
jgi:hypothetical protein